MHHVTVAICTWNRAGLLRQALEQLTKLVLPATTTWELIVVDNNSPDDTAAVIRSFEDRLPLRALFEPEMGLSHARNAAVRAARGEYIIWTDDDVLVHPDWLAAYCAAFDRWPEAAFYGGPIEPWFEGTPPAWLEPALAHVWSAYALLNLGPQPLLLNGRNVPFGANYAVRLDAQRSQLYDPSLGRRGAVLTAGEETAVLYALVRRGLTGRWIPDAVVRHFIPARRQTIGYLRRHYAGNGRAMAYEFDDPRSFLGCPYWVWRVAVESEASYRYYRLIGAPARWAEHLVLASRAWGAIFSDRADRRSNRLPAHARRVSSGPDAPPYTLNGAQCPATLNE